MTKDQLNDEYFEWLVDLVCGRRFSKHISYKKLLTHLHSVTFTYFVPYDINRAEDGVDLRYRYGLIVGHTEIADEIEGPCSVLEMMIALAIRCEEQWMDNPTIGDRTGQWFWEMVATLGLGKMADEKYDCIYVDEVLERFLNREYEPDGEGGLFRIRNCKFDLRTVEIWKQLCWYLNTLM